MRTLGWDSEAENEIESVRAAPSRIVRDGVAQRAGYGQYQRIEHRTATVERFAELPERAVPVRLARDEDARDLVEEARVADEAPSANAGPVAADVTF